MENLCFLIKLTLYKSHIRRRVPAEAIAIATPTQVNQEIRTSHVWRCSQAMSHYLTQCGI